MKPFFLCRRNNEKKRSAKADILLYLPFFVVLLISVVYHIRMHPMGGDDPFFADALNGTGFVEYLANRYTYWTSRIVLEGILVMLARAPWLWRILDCLIFAAMPCLFASLADSSKNRILGEKDSASDPEAVRKSRLIHWCAAAGMLLFPFHDMGTAGWITTTETHFWPLWSTLFIAVVLKKILLKEKIPVWMSLFSIPVCFIAGSHEQYAVILAVLLFLLAVRLIMETKKNIPHTGRKNLLLFFILCAICLFSLFVIFLCPGNAARNAVSLADLPVYRTFGFGDKLYLGLLSLERVFLANADIVFFAFSLLLVLLVFIRTGSVHKTIFAALPGLILFGHTTIVTAYPTLCGLFPKPGQILEWNWHELSVWLPMFYLFIAVIAVIYALYQIFGSDRQLFFFLLVMFGCGFGAGAVLGFMATIYVSGERVYAALYTVLILSAVTGIEKTSSLIPGRVNPVCVKLTAAFFALLCTVNVCFLFLSV